MPAPDYPRVSFPPPGGDDNWWFEPPIESRIFEAIDSVSPRLAATCAAIDRWPAPKVAEALDKGLIDGWPWQLTDKGRRVLGSVRRR